MKNTDPLMGAKLKSKTHLLNVFIDFFAVFWLSASKFAECDQIFFISNKSYKKNTEFHADFESIEKVVKRCTKKML